MAVFKASVVSRSCMGFHVLNHADLLKPALQAWRASLWCHDQVLTHLALLKSALQAWESRWGVVWVSGALCQWFNVPAFAIQAQRVGLR